jgi:FkbM family methyltransferase
MVYSLCRAMRIHPWNMRWLRITRVETLFGKFDVRSDTIDIACVSPAFERRDLDYVLRAVRERIAQQETIVFIDVGSGIGTYAISVANQLKHTDLGRILAFEPSSSSFALLGRNVALNELDGIIHLYQTALGETHAEGAILHFNPREPGSSCLLSGEVRDEAAESVRVAPLDSLFSEIGHPDLLVIKIDVEGMEIDVLKGAQRVLSGAADVLLLLEDFVDNSIVAYLESNHWRFLDKLTPYNSLWSYTKAAGDVRA